MKRFFINLLLAMAVSFALSECGQETPTPAPDMHDYCDGSMFEPLSCGVH